MTATQPRALPISNPALRSAADGYAGLISSGPWVLSILGVMGIGIFSVNRVASVAVRQFLVSVTYLMAASLILTGFLQLMFTRFIADRLFAKEDEAVLPNLFLQIGNSGTVQNLPFGGTAVLIMIGVGLDTVKQIESQLMQRNYEGFLK